MQTVDNTKENKKILIIEDDQDIASLVKLHLSDLYADVQSIHDGLQGFEIAQGEWDLILLDIRLPNMNGLDICKQLRAKSISTPILMLTSKSSDIDQVLGLELGADDYITKPFSLMNLSARVKAALRRQNLSSMAEQQTSTEQAIYQHGQIELDIKKRKASIQSKLIKLTAKEFDLLLHFVKSPGTVFSRNDLLNQVWKYNTHQGYEHTVNSHINRLRNKLSEHLDGKECIVTVWGVGYKLNEAITSA